LGRRALSLPTPSLKGEFKGITMKILVYSAQSYDKDFLNKANKDGVCDFHFTEAQLKPDSVVMAKGFEGVCCFVNDDLSKPVLEKLASYDIKLVLLRCTGFNNVDLEAAEKLGITVMRVAKYSPYSVAEFTVGLMLNLNRKIHRAYMRVKEENFLLDGLMGFDMHGKTVGILGTGKIGTVVAKILGPGFGMNVLAHDLEENPKVKEYGGTYVELDDLLRNSDIVTLHIPLTPDTYHLINKDKLALMKKGAFLINTSRGAVVDTRALIDSLKKKHIGGAGLDVYEEEGDIFYKNLSEEIIDDEVFLLLLTFPNVIVTGHQAYFTKEALTHIAETTIKNVKDFLANRTNENVLVASKVIKTMQP